MKTLNDLENKIGSYNGKIKVLQEELELLSENIKNLKQVESNLLISHKQVSYKYLKQVENHKLCINEVILFIYVVRENPGDGESI